ncbi:MAG: tRNA 2-thiouridine(34) synthase MnmA [Pirellulales bacterium]|nr:tRNA 2-thiouridine(34) synthase MnmA [Pirellulales bacterium]
MKRKVAIAISGGVDSAISAYLLQEMGYEVVGVHFQFWTWGNNLSSSENLKRTLVDDIREKIGLRIEIIKEENYFKKTIVDNFLSELSKGQTPNPCVRCNPFVKFKLLKDFAEKENIINISTGHYARVESNHGRNYKLIKGVDPEKDQSYMLCNLNQELLSRTIFPLGGTYKKDNIDLGKNLGLKIIEFPESQDLCFVDTKYYKQFISESIPNSIQPGDIIDKSGKTIGRYKGLVYYTIGQRKDIRVSAEKPYYVIRKDIFKNQLIVGHIDELGRDQMVVNNLNWIYKQPIMPFTCDVKIRYKSPYVRCRIEIASESEIKVNLSRKLRDITPGQYAVFYSGDEVLGGGIISGKEQ